MHRILRCLLWCGRRGHGINAGFRQDKVLLVARRKHIGQPPVFTTLALGGTLDLLAYFKDELAQAFKCNILARADWTKAVFDSSADLVDNLFTALVQQPPAEGQVFAVRFEIIAVDTIVVIVIVVLEGDVGRLRGVWWAGERDDRREVCAATEQVELDTGEKGQKGEGI